MYLSDHTVQSLGAPAKETEKDVTLGELFNLPKPQFPHMQKENTIALLNQIAVKNVVVHVKQ